MRIGVSWEQGRRERTGLLALGGLQGATTEAEQPLVPRALAALELAPTAATALVTVTSLEILHSGTSFSSDAKIYSLAQPVRFALF